MGEPARVSLYRKLALLAPAAMTTLVMEVVSPVSRNRPLADVLTRPTVWAVAAVAALLYGSCSVAVMVVEVTPAVSACSAVVNTSLLAAAALTVSTWVVDGLAR